MLFVTQNSETDNDDMLHKEIPVSRDKHSRRDDYEGKKQYNHVDGSKSSNSNFAFCYPFLTSYGVRVSKQPHSTTSMTAPCLAS